MTARYLAIKVFKSKIEILPVSLLKDQMGTVNEFRRVSEQLGVFLGWHYLLDLSWEAQQLGHVQKMQVIDARAGKGIMQWWLAE